MPNPTSAKLFFVALISSLTIHLILQPHQLTVQGLRWQPPANLFQSDSLSAISDKFMENLNNNNRDPSAQTVLTFEDCGQSTDAITIEKFEVDPDPPKPGHKATIYASGTVHQLIEDGAYADVTVKLGSFIKLIQKRFDICEELSKANATIQCPIEPGYYDIVQVIELPREVPRAKYTVEARAYTQADEDMACTNVVLDFLKS